MCNQAPPLSLIIIDALDECKEQNATSTILSALSIFTARPPLSPIKFLITSRPVPVIKRGFHITGLMKNTKALVLHNILLDISQKDIRIYLTERLSVIARYFDLKSWPSSEALEQLVNKSSRLFIFAATTVNFIEDPNASSPIHQLQIMLTTEYITSTGTSPYHHLDTLYLAVLRVCVCGLPQYQRGLLG
jgi:hypothetical protein